MRNRNRTNLYQQTTQTPNQCSLMSNTPKQFAFEAVGRKSQIIQYELSKILDKRKKKIFNQLIRGSRGRNNPINYDNQFDFLQRWQTLNKQNDFHNVNYELPQNIIGLVINVMFLLQKTVVVWFLSIYRIFGLSDTYWPFVLGFIFALFSFIWKGNIAIKHYSNFKKQNNPNFQQSQHLKTLIQVFGFDLYTLIYFCVSIISSQYGDGFLGLIIFDGLTVFCQYHKGQSLYKRIKLYGIRSSYKNYMNLFDLMSNLFIIFHFCAILIYSVTLYHENNWIDSLAANPSDWHTKYLYSLYFTSTTMLTVGYGDILPTNKLQISIILLIQVLGTAINGYIFSQVGHTLAKIREKTENQQKDISDTQKLAKVYRLDNQLAKKMRQFIILNETQNQELNIEEENKLLHKFNDELRTQVNNFNHMHIIKENIFFLFYFSKKAQIQFAKRLQRKLLSPNESVYQIQGKQRLFIVTKGRLEIYTDRKQGMKFYCKKKLKQINRNDKKQHQISDNIFGYSSVIWGKPTNLRALTKDFTIIYNLQKSDMMQVINDDTNDFQSFAQLKQKILLQKYPQRWEVPRITSIREHYAPLVIFLIKKEKASMRKFFKKQRKQLIRSDRRCKRIFPIPVMDFLGNSQNDSSDDSVDYNQEKNTHIYQNRKPSMRDQNRMDKYTQIKQLQSRQLTSTNIVHRSYKRKYVNNKKYEQRRRKQLIQKWQGSKKDNQNMNFQVFKNFNCFFKKRNLSQILKKLTTQSMQTQINKVNETIKPLYINTRRNVLHEKISSKFRL